MIYKFEITNCGSEKCPYNGARIIIKIMDYKPFPFHNLLDWYEKNGRHTLPWRQYFHLSIRELTYHVWLSEILLQQTQASRVIPFYENILKKYPTIESLASATYEEFFPYYQ